MSTQEGWKCPECGRVNAPWVRECACFAIGGTPEPWRAIPPQPQPYVPPSTGDPLPTPMWPTFTCQCEGQHYNSLTAAEAAFTGVDQ